MAHVDILGVLIRLFFQSGEIVNSQEAIYLNNLELLQENIQPTLTPPKKKGEHSPYSAVTNIYGGRNTVPFATPCYKKKGRANQIQTC